MRQIFPIQWITMNTRCKLGKSLPPHPSLSRIKLLCKVKVGMVQICDYIPDSWNTKGQWFKSWCYNTLWYGSSIVSLGLTHWFMVIWLCPAPLKYYWFESRLQWLVWFSDASGPFDSGWFRLCRASSSIFRCYRGDQWLVDQAREQNGNHQNIHECKLTTFK